ncbi:MAG: hypothetical protein KDA85_14660 [Planctomycetaceae bacterium]|nr:hypothetical protein [Planctomycetaceae bacterium]
MTVHGDRFRISFPINPQNNPLDGHISLLCATDRAAYTLVTTDYETVPDAARLLDEIQSKVVGNLPVLRRETVELPQADATRRVMYRDEDGDIQVMLWVVADLRLYQLGVVTTDADQESAGIPQFFESFQLFE